MSFVRRPWSITWFRIAGITPSSGSVPCNRSASIITSAPSTSRSCAGSRRRSESTACRSIHVIRLGADGFDNQQLLSTNNRCAWRCKNESPSISRGQGGGGLAGVPSAYSGRAVSAISLNGYPCPWPSTAFFRRLVRLLAIDERRSRPPITLAGPAPPAPSPPPLPPKPPAALHTVTGRLRWAPYRRDDTLEHHRTPFQPGDECWPYSRDQLLRMDLRFSRRLRRALASGKESRAAAEASVAERSSCPRPLGSFDPPGHDADLRAA